MTTARSGETKTLYRIKGDGDYSTNPDLQPDNHNGPWWLCEEVIEAFWEPDRDKETGTFSYPDRVVLAISTEPSEESVPFKLRRQCWTYAGTLPTRQRIGGFYDKLLEWLWDKKWIKECQATLVHVTLYAIEENKDEADEPDARTRQRRRLLRRKR